MTNADLLATPLVREAILRAKGIAVAIGAKALTLRLIIAGFHRLLADGDPDAVETLSDSADGIRAALIGQNLSVDIDLGAVAAMRLPVSDSLRVVLAQDFPSVSAMVDGLLSALGPDDEEVSALFMQVMTRASAASRLLNKAEIEPEIFAVAAYHGFLAGDFRERSEVAVHIAANKADFEILAAARQWTPEYFRTDAKPTLPPTDAFRKSLDEGRNNRLLTGINLGAAAGAMLRQRRVTAFHEAGHAVVWFLLRPQAPITQVSIIPVTDSEGRLEIDPTAPYLRLPDTRKHLIEDTCICLAGNIAQQVEFGIDGMDEGAQSDLVRATSNVWKWVAHFGLDEQFGPVSIPTIAEVSGAPTGWLHDRAQERVQQLLKECASRTKQLLQENWHYVQLVAAALVDRSKLSAEELLELLIERGLADWPGVCHVRSLPIMRSVRFADESGGQTTPEGRVPYEAGDAIVSGENGETWPVPRHVFEQRYEPEGSSTFGEVGWFRKRTRAALALRLTASRNVVLSKSRGVLTGKPGDWVVDYGEGDLAIVADSIFLRVYEILY